MSFGILICYGKLLWLLYANVPGTEMEQMLLNVVLQFKMLPFVVVVMMVRVVVVGGGGRGSDGSEMLRGYGLAIFLSICLLL